MPLKELDSILMNHYCVYGEQKNSGFSLYYDIMIHDSIRITIDVMERKIFRIVFFNQYKGKYKGVGIGSTIEELLKVRNDVFFDEDYILVGERPYDFIIKIDNNDDSIYSLDDVLHNSIISISIEDQQYKIKPKSWISQIKKLLRSF